MGRISGLSLSEQYIRSTIPVLWCLAVTNNAGIIDASFMLDGAVLSMSFPVNVPCTGG